MYKLDIYGNPEPLSIYLSKVDGTILGCLDNIIDPQTASLTINLNKQCEVSFEIYNLENEKTWYDYVHEGMYLLVDNVGLFKINQPTISMDGERERKSVKAYSVDCELEDKTIVLSINTGKKDSMEYLVKYDDDETEELVNPYTGIPYDWIVIYNTFPEQLESFDFRVQTRYYGSTVTDPEKIQEITDIITLIPRLKSKVTYTDNSDGSKDSVLTEYIIANYDDNGNLTSYTLADTLRSRIQELIKFYKKYRHQLSLISIVLESMGGSWNFGKIYGTFEDIRHTVANQKYQFEINETVYSFLTNTFAEATKCVVNFDIWHRKVNMTPVEYLGDDTGIVVGYDTLVNSLDISTEEDRLATRLYVTGGDDLEITRVNFGSNYVDDLSYKMNARGSDGERIYVSDSLAEKYETYKEYREEQRTAYIDLSKQYEEYASKISDIENRLPNDNLKNDWSTFTQDELKASLTNFKNLLVTLKSLYKSDYGDAGLNSDGSIKESFIRNTMYWWDYEAYNNIIDEIETALAVFPYYSDDSHWSEPPYNLTDAQIVAYKAKISAWETEWSLYGTIELQAKIDIYKQNMDLMLAEQEGIGSEESSSTVIRKNASGYEIKTWNELSADEKASYGNNSLLYHYDLYMEYYNNSVSAQAYLDILLDDVKTLQVAQESVQSQRNTILNNVTLENYFTEDECKIIYRLFRDSDYSNENIISTSIDSSSEKIDHMFELLEDAQIQVSETSRPQLQFSVGADNLLSLSEFQPFWASFQPGNYILVQYKDNTYVKLRMLGFTVNPSLPSSNNLQIEFSNFVRSKAYYRDWGSLFGTSSGGGSSRSSSGGSSGGGYGESDDIDITISNTMLAKLLNTELFGTRVTDVILETIDANKLSARFATFGGLSKGTTLIDGKCIQTGYIIDKNYNGKNGNISNTEGSILNLETGYFNFGGGKIKYDGSLLNVDGHIKARSLSTGNKTSSSKSANQSGLYIDSSGNLYAGADNQVSIKADGTFNFGSGSVVYDGSALTVSGNITAESLSTGNKTSSAIGQSGLYIDSSGNLYAGADNQVSITSTGELTLGINKLIFDGTNLTARGTVYALAGNFGRTNPFQISDNGLDGSISGKATTSYWTTKVSNSALLSGSAFRSQFAFNIQRVSSDIGGDIELQDDNVDSAILSITYQYTITVTETIKETDDEGEAPDDDDGDDGTTSGGTSSTSSSSSTTTTTTTTTDIVSTSISVSDITMSHTISVVGTTKVYTFVGALNIGSVTIDDYLKNNVKTLSGLSEGTSSSTVDNRTTTTTRTISVIDANVQSTYSYRFLTFEVYSHIGTDYFQYAGMLTVEDDQVTLGNTVIEDGLSVAQNIIIGSNSYIRGLMANNDYWRIAGGGTNDAGYLEIATADNGNEPIYIRQYSGLFSTVTRTLTLLDGSGQTILPGTLRTSKIQTTATYIELASSVVFANNTVYMGWTSNASERGIVFSNMGASSATYRHNVKLYGGNGASTTAIGIWDNRHNHSVLYYKEDDQSVRVRGWDGSARVPVHSNTTAKKRVAYLSTGSSTKLYVKAQWNSNSYSGKNLSVSSSDIRLKENIGDCEVESALDLINKIQIRSFDWNDREEDIHQKIGFIADELDQLDPRLSIGGGYDEEGNIDVKSVDTFYLLGYVVKAIQEMDERLIKLEKRK